MHDNGQEGGEGAGNGGSGGVDQRLIEAGVDFLELCRRHGVAGVGHLCCPDEARGWVRTAMPMAVHPGWGGFTADWEPLFSIEEMEGRLEAWRRVRATRAMLVELRDSPARSLRVVLDLERRVLRELKRLDPCLKLAKSAGW